MSFFIILIFISRFLSLDWSTAKKKKREKRKQRESFNANTRQRVSSFLTCRMDGAGRSVESWFTHCACHESDVLAHTATLYAVEKPNEIWESFYSSMPTLLGRKEIENALGAESRKKMNRMILTGNNVAIDTQSRSQPVPLTLTRFSSRNLLKIQTQFIDWLPFFAYISLSEQSHSNEGILRIHERDTLALYALYL